jgi:acetyl esterase/lipase
MEAGGMKRSTRKTGWWLGAQLCVLLLAGAVPAMAASSAPPLPSNDPFYTYSGSTPLARFAPGSILKTRTIAVSESDTSSPPGVATPITATQVLYRTTGELGQPTADVATIVHPLVALQAGKIVSWQMAYDGLGGECDPSYGMQGGTPTTDTNGIEEQPIVALAAAGYTVVTPDYEGIDNQWLAGQEAGYGTLDAIRATETLLKLAPANTRVGMIGYSGGSVPTNFAAELAPTYAPKLDIVGAAFGGVPVDLAHTLAYISDSTSWSNVIPGSLEGVARAFGINLGQYLSPLGEKLVSEDQGACINTFADPAPFTYGQLLAPQYQHIFAVPRFAKVFNHLIMGNNGTPAEPLFIGNGDSDGIGDGVMIAADVEALAHAYCQRGVPVEFQKYTGLDHAEAIPTFFVEGIAFVTNRLAGGAVHNGCSSIPVGTSLAPLPVPSSRTKAKPKRHRKHR